MQESIWALVFSSAPRHTICSCSLTAGRRYKSWIIFLYEIKKEKPITITVINIKQIRIIITSWWVNDRIKLTNFEPINDIHVNLIPSKGCRNLNRQTKNIVRISHCAHIMCILWLHISIEFFLYHKWQYSLSFCELVSCVLDI